MIVITAIILMFFLKTAVTSSPYLIISHASEKNRMPWKTIVASIKVKISISKAPAVIVSIWYGIGIIVENSNML